MEGGGRVWRRLAGGGGKEGVGGVGNWAVAVVGHRPALQGAGVTAAATVGGMVLYRVARVVRLALGGTARRDHFVRRRDHFVRRLVYGDHLARCVRSRDHFVCRVR